MSPPAATERPARQSDDLEDDAHEYAHVTLTQRMLSASIGNFFTSVLVTPLDVVRVRLQSQIPISNPPISLRSSHPTPTTSPLLFKELPPNLGITSCCREVFWVGNTSPFCIAESSLSASPTHALSHPHEATTCVAEATQRHTFTSTFDGLRKIARHEGALALWRGLSPTLVMGVPANVIYFTGYDWLRLDTRSPFYNYIPDSYAPLVCGSVARILAATSISPIEMFRTRLQATAGRSRGGGGAGAGAGREGQKGHFRDTLRNLRRLTQRSGYAALWRGLPLTLWRDVPFSGMYWFGYEWMRNALTDWRARSTSTSTATAHQAAELLPREGTGEHHNLIVRQAEQSEQTGTTTFIDSFVSGAVSGSIAALITTPFDIGKTRQQVFEHASDPSIPRQQQQSGSGSRPITLPQPSPHKVKAVDIRPEQLSIPRFLLHIFREEGVAGLLRGWFPRCLKVAPSCGIMISSYELCKKLAQQYNERNGERHEHERGHEAL